LTQRCSDDRLCRVRAVQDRGHRDDYSGRNMRSQALAAWLSLALVVIGTVVWGYGDLLFPRPMRDEIAADVCLAHSFPCTDAH
jgi:hypothetical protein